MSIEAQASLLLAVMLLLMSVAFVTLFERKLLALSQSRIGVNKVLLKGVLQPLLDGVKLLCKRVIVPARSMRVLYLIVRTVVLTIMIFT